MSTPGSSCMTDASSMTSPMNDPDVALVESRLAKVPDSRSVDGFVFGPGIERLVLRFDIDVLRCALEECLRRSDFMGGIQDGGRAAADEAPRSDRVDRK